MSTLTGTLRALLLALLAAAVSPLPAQQAPSLPTPPGDARTLIYTCPMHPDVRADKPGACPRCGMPLVAAAAAPERSGYRVEVETAPREVRSGEPVRLRLRVSDPITGEPVTDFHVVHEKPIHLFVVSRDLAHYAHIHPVPQSDGSLSVDTILPEPGRYLLFCDFFPVGGAPQVVSRELATADAPAPDPRPSGASRPNAARAIESAGTRFEMTLEPAQPVSGRTAVVSFRLVDARDGKPAADLQPYLGSLGHAVALRSDGTDFVHTHATTPLPRVRGAPSSGARISFPVYFGRPGPHRIWSEFRRGDAVVAASFDVSVASLERLASWSGGEWSVPTSGERPEDLPDGAIRAVAAAGAELYVGGDFTRVDGVPANRVARWDGRKWSALGDGVDGRVWAIAVRGADVYVGGDFTAAGGVSTPGVARWNGRSWSGLGRGVGGRRDAWRAPTVYALAWSEGSLYAGGEFESAGGVEVNGVARWNGREWTGLGGGVRTGAYDGVVRALAVHGGDVYAGGRFLSAGGARADNVARWDGRAWSALGAGVRGHLEKVLAIAVAGDDVYVGGAFSRAGGVPASNFARWSAGRWAPLPVRAGDGVWTIAVAGHRVYAGGTSFTLPDGRTANGVVAWNGEAWSDLSGGLGSGGYAGPVMAIAAAGERILAGGDLFSLPPASGAAAGPAPAR